MQYEEAIEMLMAHVVTVSTPDLTGCPALHFGVERYVLINAMAKVDVVTSRGLAHLYLLIKIARSSAAWSTPNLFPPKGGNLLHEAVYTKKIAIVHEFLSAAPELLQFDQFGRTDMDWALADTRMLQILWQLLQRSQPQ